MVLLLFIGIASSQTTEYSILMADGETIKSVSILSLVSDSVIIEIINPDSSITSKTLYINHINRINRYSKSIIPPGIVGVMIGSIGGFLFSKEASGKTDIDKLENAYSKPIGHAFLGGIGGGVLGSIIGILIDPGESYFLYEKDIQTRTNIIKSILSKDRITSCSS